MVDKTRQVEYKGGMSNQFCQWCGRPTNNDDSLSGHKLKTCGRPACVRKQLSETWKIRKRKARVAAKIRKVRN
jgi:hypothetical protein